MYLHELRSRKFSSIKVLLFAYVVFILATAFFCFLNIVKLNDVSSIQGNQYLQENLKNAKYSIESELTNVKNTLDQLSNMRCIEDILTLSESNTNILIDEPYAIYSTVVELRSIKNTVKPIAYIGTFVKSSNIAIDINSSYTAPDYFNNIFRLEDVDASRWYGLTDGFQNFYLIPSYKVELNGQIIEGFTFAKTVPPNSIGSKGVIFIMVKRSYLDNLMQSMDFDIYTTGAIVDDKNNIIATSKNFKNPALPGYSQVDPQSFISSVDKKYSYIAIQLNNLPWKLVLIKDNKFDNYFSSIGINAALALAIILIIGILLSILLYKFYSGSLNAITSIINFNLLDKNDFVFADVTRKNIYKVFEHKFKALLYEISSLSEDISQYKTIIKNYALVSALRPCKTTEEYDMFTKLHDEMFVDSQAFIICIYIQNTKKNNNELKAYIHINNFMQKNNLLLYSIEHVDHFNVFWGYLNNKQLQYYGELCASIIKYKKEIEIEYDIHIYTEFGPLCTSIDLLINSYKALSIKLKVQTCPIDYNDIQYFEAQRHQNTVEFLPVPKENLLIRHLNSGDAYEIEKLIKDLLNININDKSSLNLYKQALLFYELLALIIRYIEEEKNNLGIQPPDYIQIKTFDDIIQLLKQLCFLRKNSENKDTQVVNQKSDILKFIDDNFLDHSLSQKIIKDKFNVSLSFITKTVKELTEDGFLDYLNKKRIKHAKKLLQCPEVTISKARDLSGYNDDSVFIKVFKKYEGKTPGKYKKMLQK